MGIGPAFSIPKALAARRHRLARSRRHGDQRSLRAASHRVSARAWQRLDEFGRRRAAESARRRDCARTSARARRVRGSRSRRCTSCASAAAATASPRPASAAAKASRPSSCGVASRQSDVLRWPRLGRARGRRRRVRAVEDLPRAALVHRAALARRAARGLRASRRRRVSRRATSAGASCFWIFTRRWCEPCKLELPLVEGVVEQRIRDAVVVPVDVGEPRSIAAAFARRFALRDVALDPR